MYLFYRKNGNLAAVTSYNKIAVIKLKQDNYQIFQTIDIGLFNMLGQLWNGTLIGCSKGEIIFFHKNNNLYSKNFGIKIKETSKFIFQTKRGEIVYSDCDKMNQIIFYDFINKREIECINHIDISRNDIFNIGMISKELLFVTSEGKNIT